MPSVPTILERHLPNWVGLKLLSGQHEELARAIRHLSQDPDSDTRFVAKGVILNTVANQGLISEAAPYLVRLLLDLLPLADFPETDWAAKTLVQLASWVADPYKQSSRKSEIKLAMSMKEIRRAPTKLDRLKWRLLCYEAVQHAWRLLCDLSRKSAAPSTRRMLSFATCVCRDQQKEVSRHQKSTFDNESDSQCAASIVLAIGALQVGADTVWLEHTLNDERPEVAWSSAAALVNRGHPLAPRIAHLIAATAADEETARAILENQPFAQVAGLGYIDDDALTFVPSELARRVLHT
ncbi:MAG: hypothetical protein AB7K09_14710 [Planctomycetota bacterium]